jgi:hypothetical protein
MNAREDEKAARERTIFVRFAKAAGLVVEEGSIQSDRPPRPDISCKIRQTTHHFELGEITDQGLAARVAQAIREMRITGGFFSQDRPLVNLLKQKAKKNYENLGGRLELVLYYDKQYPPPADGLKHSTIREIELCVSSMLAGPWSRIWIFDNWNEDIIASWE